MTDSTVELVYFSGCPNVELARGQLRDALLEAGVSTTWTEWDVLDDQTPPAYRAFPSPTVLVSGHDVMGDSIQTGMACRAGGAPPARQILAALRGDG